ncbi:hypothetical protein L226DRAFT_167536 [Lentinus tigrinus ALCF2SS1-7]|uniref:uncharacterized protein n=1 Tax=Lentinus tigrinus ALCF2SS1-7 TaxID=1328758 RepID=UPI001165DB22|nr:hypothetical protein L226DRAFT_167536 [Lentinus tigrinus ALCF2SS1-7]
MLALCHRGRPIARIGGRQCGWRLLSIAQIKTSRPSPDRGGSRRRQCARVHERKRWSVDSWRLPGEIPRSSRWNPAHISLGPDHRPKRTPTATFCGRQPEQRRRQDLHGRRRRLDTPAFSLVSRPRLWHGRKIAFRPNSAGSPPELSWAPPPAVTGLSLSSRAAVDRSGLREARSEVVDRLHQPHDCVFGHDLWMLARCRDRGEPSRSEARYADASRCAERLRAAQLLRSKSDWKMKETVRSGFGERHETRMHGYYDGLFPVRGIKRTGRKPLGRMQSLDQKLCVPAWPKRVSPTEDPI